MYVIISLYFPICFFFCVVLSDLVYVSLYTFFMSTQFFFHVIFTCGLSVMFFMCSYLAPETFASFAPDCSFVLMHSPQTFGEIFFRYFGRFYFYLIFTRYLLIFPSFTNIFWFISSSCVVSLLCCFLFFFSFIIPLCLFPFSVLSLVLIVSLFVLLASFSI